MPMKRSGRSVAAASRVIEIDEVLEATSASAFRTAQRSWKILRLTSSFSVAVSITRSQSASPSRVSESAMRESASVRASSVMIFLATCRDRLPLTVAMPDFSRSAETSLSTTSSPASAATCAIPLPIWPEPITPTFLIIATLSSTETARASRRPFDPLRINTGRSFCIRPVESSLLSELADGLCQFGNHLIEIRDQTVICNLEDRRILVLVDRDDDFGVLHAGEMLNCAGDADRDIKFRRHHLAGLPDLPVVGRIACVDCGARGADAGAELVGERLDIFGEVLAALHCPPAGDDDFRRSELGTVAFRDFLADEAGEPRIGGGGSSLDRRAAAGARRGEGRGSHRDDLFGVVGLDGLDRVAGIDRPLEGVGRYHLDDLGHLHDIEQRG